MLADAIRERCRVTPRSNDSYPVIGLSSNVVDAELGSGQFDGIGVYTVALEQALRRIGVATCKVGAPVLRGLRLKWPTGSQVNLPVPLALAIAWSSLTGTAIASGAAVRQSIDLYHCTDYRVPRLARIPVVATLYDAIPIMHPQWANPRLRSAKNWLLKAGAANADLVIAISAAAADQVERYYRVHSERIRVVHLGVADEWFQVPPAKARQAARDACGVDAGYFLFVGTLQPRKNLATLLDAYQRLSPALRAARRLIIVGKYGWGAQDERRRLKALAAAGQVRWLEYVDGQVLRALYRAAGACVFPSLAEGFGLPVLESLASGVPVVASDIEAVREVAGDHALLTPPRDARALADAMAAALELPRDAATDGARQAWARTYSWERCAAGTREVYREVLGR